ncbi:MAG: hypothetical protein ACKVOP_10570 [Sphingomonadaceae bacterium]
MSGNEGVPPVRDGDLVQWLKDYRKAHPLPPSTGLQADKAFFDSLSDDEPGDGQFQFTDLA